MSHACVRQLVKYCSFATLLTIIANTNLKTFYVLLILFNVDMFMLPLD